MGAAAAPSASAAPASTQASGAPARSALALSCGGKPDRRIARAELEGFLDDPRITGAARLMPIADADAGTGVRVAGIRRDGFLERAGLRSGDTVLTVNGVTPDSVEKLTALQTSVRSAKEIRVRLVRDGSPFELCIEPVDASR